MRRPETLPAAKPLRQAALRHISSSLSDSIGTGALTGVVACAADRDGEFYQGAFGLADMARSTPMRKDTLFFIASMTKTVTHVAIMQVIEQGKLSLDDKAAGFIPELTNRQVLDGFDDDGMPILRAPKGDITVRQLLAYTAGFAYPYWHADLQRYVEWAELPSSVSYLKRSLELPLVSDPGDRWNYGINTEFLGLIVEHVSGERLDHYFQRHIFDPLGMRSTFYDVPPDQLHRIAQVHTRAPDGGLSAIELTLPEQPEFYPGGVGLFSTANDYLALTRMLLDGGALHGQRILRAESIDLMSANQLEGATMAPMTSCNPFWSCDVELFPGQDTQWGLGFLLNTQSSQTGRAAFSLTWGGACNTFYWVDRTRGVTGVFMTAVVPFCDARALTAFTSFEASVYAAL